MVPGAPRTVLYLVRHGEADSNRDGRIGGWSPVPLTALGRHQAERAAVELARRQPTRLITSDIVRAQETAAPIAVATGLTPTLEPGLRERSLGVLDGLSFEEVKARHPTMWERMMARDASSVPEGGEAADDVFRRVGAALTRIVTEHAGERIAVVSHGLALYHAFAYVCGLGSPAQPLPVFVLVDNASITQLEHRREPGPPPVDRWRIISLNDTAHLRDLAAGAPASGVP